MSIFKPTYLYIKQHSVTGKLYFGKTIRDPEKYYGSGSHWHNHIVKHGKNHVVNLWYCLFHDKDECNKFALMFSRQNNIVESDEWLNLIEENGIDSRTGTTMSEKTKKKIGDSNRGRKHSPEEISVFSAAMKGRKHSDEHKAKISAGLTGREVSEETREKIASKQRGVSREKHSEDTRAKISAGNKGKVVSDETKQKMRDYAKSIGRIPPGTLGKKWEIVICPHCSKEGGKPAMIRYHFDNCKHKYTNNYRI